MENPIGAGVADGVPEGVLRGGAALQGEGDAARPRAEHAEHHEGHPLRLGYALNAFDHRDLFLWGFREWSRGLDARISGKRLPDARLLGLFTTGFRTGALRMLLMEHLGNEGGVSHGGPEGILKEHSPLLSRASIAQPVGFDVLSLQDGFLQGHLLFLAPEHRGRGLCGAYFDAVTRLARESGHRGFCFLSTLPKWRRNEYPFSRRLHMRQADGTEVRRYWREA